MKHKFKIALATSALIAIAGTASAEDTTFEVKFHYDSTAPVDVTYASLLKTAKNSCRSQYSLFTSGYSKETMRRFRRQCQRMLVDQAVYSIESASLTAFHTGTPYKVSARHNAG